MSVKLYAFTCGTVTGEFAHLMEGGDGDITVPIPVFLIEHPKGRGSAGEGSDASCVGSLSLRLFGWREPTRGDLKDWSCHAGPMVRILFPPAGASSANRLAL